MKGTNMTDKILRLADLEKKIALSRTTIYRMMDESLMPKQLQLVSRAVGWRESTIDAWFDSKTHPKSS
jgi:prophage regulatory protein